MEIVNYSAEPVNKLYSWLPHNIKAEQVVFLPDACPGKSTLPTGCVVLTKQANWRELAVSDCGCGMRFLKSGVGLVDFKQEDWDAVYKILKEHKGGLGDLGSGNHFLNAMVSQKDEKIYFLIHTGSRQESKLVDDYIDKPGRFEDKYKEVSDWAKCNRKKIGEFLAKIFGSVELVLDKPHNSFEIIGDGSVIVRKGAVKTLQGEINIIPSNMDGDAVLVEATAAVSKALNSLSHGTGRTMSRGEAKEYAEQYDYKALRKRVYIPENISDASIRTEAPFCYRDIDKCLGLIGELIEEVDRLTPIAYMGQL